MNIEGRKFGRLTAIRFVEWHHFKSGKRQQKWEFICDCGKMTVAFFPNVKSGHTKSCGCWESESRRLTHTTHGGAKRKEYLYTVWCGIKQRCEDTGYKFYSRWGGRGIQVLWKSYEEFRSDMLPSYRPGLEIERIDNNGPYSKFNCRWATNAEQSRNRRSNVDIEFHGLIMCRTDWAESFGLQPETLRHRLKAAWPMEEALTRPLFGH